MGEGGKVKNDSNFTLKRVMVILKANLDEELFFLFLGFLFFHKHCNNKWGENIMPQSVQKYSKYSIHTFQVIILFTITVFVT